MNATGSGLGILLSFIFCSYAPQDDSETAKARLLTSIPMGDVSSVGNVVFSPYLEVVGYQADGCLCLSHPAGYQHQSWRLAVKGRQLEGIGREAPILSANGRTYVFVQQFRDGKDRNAPLKERILVNGQEAALYDVTKESASTPVISSDGAKVAFVRSTWVRRGDGRPLGKPVLVQGERKGDHFVFTKDESYANPSGALGEAESLTDLDFDALGQLVFLVRPLQGKNFIVRGDRKGQGFNNVTRPHLDPTGRHVLCRVERGFEDFVLMDDQLFPAPATGGIQGFDPIRCSSDGKVVAFVTQENRKAPVVRVGEKTFPSVWENSCRISLVGLSPSGKHFAYSSSKGLCRDGTELEAYPSVGGREQFINANTGSLIVSEEGKVAYVLGDALVVSGKWKEGLSIQRALLPSPDGRRFASVARRILIHEAEPDRFRVVLGTVDTAEITVGDPYDSIGELIFSPKDDHFLYLAFRKNQVLLVLDGKPHPVPGDRALGPPILSSDSHRVGYGALKGSELWWQVYND